MTKKLLALLFAALMIVTCMAGCQTVKEVWVSEEVVGEGADTNKTSRTKKTTTGEKASTDKTTKGQGGDPVSRTTRNAKDVLTFKPVADAGADYEVTGNVSIAVDTVRPTDYDAMFDVMQQLYPNISFTFDYWTHSTNDDGREYLTTRMKTGTAANIMWDEAGELPVYLRQGWIYPITKKVAADPEAKNIPANLKSDYTFCGELYAVPHQATFETIAFNMDLLARTGLGLPKLEWAMKDNDSKVYSYEDYLSAGADLFNQGIALGITDLFSAHYRVCWYETSKTGGRYGCRAYNWDTKQMEVGYLITGAQQFRAWRVLKTGVEGWYESVQKNSAGQSNVQQKLGLSQYSTAWKAGKALIEDTMNVYCDKWDDLAFNWKMWTTPNYKGNMMMHVDHCFITTTTPDADIDACYQALRFMTFTTNGNLARLTMYEDSQKSKYNLNSVVYFPTTTNATVLDKFDKLSCTTDVHTYYLRNIKNSDRYDTFKLVPELRELDSKHLKQNLNDITDGLETGENLREPAEKWNTDMKAAWVKFEKELKTVQADFNKKHK